MLRPAIQLTPSRWLSMPTAQRRGLFFPARRTLRTNANAGAVPQRASALAHNHSVTNMRILNHVLLHITVHPNVGAAAPRQGIMAEKTIRSFAGNTIDDALRQELDRQLAFMRRGENLGENRRRRLMLDQYLRYRVSPAAPWFYSAPMVHQTAGDSRARPENPAFHSDIIHERQTNVTSTTLYRREIAVAASQPTVQPARSGEQAKEIADQVYRRVEQQLRMSRERSGRLF